jgi:Tfp pilus assembly protein PilF
LRANPLRADTLQNFALFLETRRRDADTAEQLYQRAITLSPRHYVALTNFAVFLKNVTDG